MRTISKRSKIILIIAVSILLFGAIAATVIALQPKQARPNAAQVTPDFTALVPKNVSIDEVGGWQKLTPPSGDTVYVYVDTVDGALLNVSQQRLPESFKASTASSVKEMAKAYNATVPLEVSGTTAYIGTSADGPQSVIFSKNEVLVLIKSDKKIQDSSWISYINSLQ